MAPFLSVRVVVCFARVRNNKYSVDRHWHGPKTFLFSRLIFFFELYDFVSSSQECTRSHFKSNRNCPVCGEHQDENDFTEVVISDVEDGFINDPYRIFKSLLTKSPNSTNAPDEPLTFNDMIESLMMEYDATFACTQLFVKVS